MLLRMERHFKTEQAARKEAEEMLEQAAQAEIAAKNQMEDAAQKHAADEKRVQDELEAIQKERKGLETMRQEFESEVQAARVEVKKAQEALKTAEERVRADERVQKAKMEAEYQTRIIALGSELERVREELAIRTQSLGDELERWRKQAELAAVAVIEAKGEVMERRREIDVTKDRMDRLVDKLYAGREHGIVLHGALQAAQMYHGQAQARLLASMQKSYYHGVQAGLPWGGTIAGAGAKQLPAPALEEQGGEARRWGKGKAEGRGPRALGNRLPPLSARGPQGGGLQGEYPAVPSRYAQRATAQAQAQGAQAKRQQRLARQRSKDRFAGQRDRAFAVMSRWD
ncbi:unnamed protein product [Ostreobium quekettii]|uniref:Uncharacterized protein n=1 Tax=Ostreobium quekettii TaxID=121088 RepID=A0A8S1IRG5_9CHLO|nr:unnamed protein product [Ostreobium quekettii]